MGLAKPLRGTRLSAAHQLARGLFNCWLMNEGDGACVFDVVERGCGDFYYGVQWKAGSQGWCLETDGSTGYVALGGEDDRYAGAEGFSWSIRVMFRELPSTAGTGIVLDRKTPSGHSWYLQSKSWDDGMGIHFRDSGYTAHLLNGPTIEKGRWYEVTLVFNGDEVFLYVDGRMVDTTEPGSIFREAGSSLRLGHPGSYSPEVCCEHVMFWDRVLSPEEIALLAGAPYAMFERPEDRESFVHVVGLAGSLSGESQCQGLAGLACRGAWSGGSLDIERKWLRGALSAGMDGDAIKLGTVLSGGWFWMRRFGCCGLYRGDTLDGIGFEGVLSVVAVDAEEVSPPHYSPHNPNSVHHYCVRRFNEFGITEQTIAGVRVAIGPDGQLEPELPQAVNGLRASQVDHGCVKLQWFYDSMGQAAAPDAFEIYGDGASGDIDFDSAVGTVEYAGRRFYSFKCAGLGEGLHKFTVRARTIDDAPGIAAAAAVCVCNSAVGGIEIVEIECI